MTRRKGLQDVAQRRQNRRGGMALVELVNSLHKIMLGASANASDGLGWCSESSRVLRAVGARSAALGKKELMASVACV